MNLLLITLLGITVTQPDILDQTDEEWTAPGFRVVEEVSINPLDYGEPISWGENCNGPTASIGCQGFFVPTDDGEKWRIVMLLKDKIVVLQEDEESKEILLSCSPRGIVYSRNGRYALVFGSVIDAGRGITNSQYVEYVNIDTGEVHPFLPMSNTGWIGERFLNDDGSIYRWNCQSVDILEYYDSSQNLVSSTEIDISPWSDFSHAPDGSLMLFASDNKVLVFNRFGDLLWEKELEEHLPCAPMISGTGSHVLFATRHRLECYDGRSGDLLWTGFDGSNTGAPLLSVSGDIWAVTLRDEGLVVGVSIEDVNLANALFYPSENWDYGIPVAVAETGASLLTTVSLPSYNSDQRVRRVILVNEVQNIVWISSPFGIFQSSLIIYSSNNNLETNLGAGAYSIQSDGTRFIYADGDRVIVLNVENEEVQ